MTSLAIVMFALTYVGMALGRVPGLKIDRSGIALIAAVILVAVEAVPSDQIAGAIHFPTLLLMGGLMILSARVGAAGSTRRRQRGSQVKRGSRCACLRSRSGSVACCPPFSSTILWSSR
jgi:hypothetical protein